VLTRGYRSEAGQHVYRPAGG